MDGKLNPMPNGMLLTAVLIPLAVVLAFYVLRSIGVFVLAKKAGDKRAFMAFIPFVWIYTAGKLAGNPVIFGRKTKNFALIIALVFGIIEAIGFIMDMLVYIPLIGYFLQGGTVVLCESSLVFPEGYERYLINDAFYTSTPVLGAGYVYSTAFVRARAFITFFLNIAQLVEIFLLAVLYFNLFRKYSPAHYVLFSILSILGLFAPFVFAIRNNEPIDFAEFLKRRNPFYGGNGNNGNYYNGYYGNNNNYNNYNGNNGNPYSGNNGNGRNDGNDEPKSPFDDFPDDKN